MVGKYLTVLALTLSVCLCLLVLGDWFILRLSEYWLKNNTNYSEAAKIESLRIISEDKSQRAAAIMDGFSPVLYPQLSDEFKLSDDLPLIAGLPHTPTYYCNEGYGLVRYYSDRFGFRNDDALWEVKRPRIMIGDSFVHGACVSDAQTLPSQLAVRLDDAVINLGMGGNNPSHYIAYANLFIPLVKPRVVYLMFYPNDNGNWETSAIENRYVNEGRELFSPQALQYEDTAQVLNRGKDAVSMIADLQIARAQSQKQPLAIRGIGAFRRHASLPTIRSIVFRSTGFDTTERAIVTTTELCARYTCDVVIGFIPNSEFFRPDSRSEAYAEDILLISERLGLKFIDGRAVLDTKKDSLDFALKGPHLSPQGYSKMAEAMSKSAHQL